MSRKIATPGAAVVSEDSSTVESSRPSELLSAEESLIVAGVEFSFCLDGDLEIDMGTHVSLDGRWDGRFLDREDTIKLRDYLNRMLPL
jgi:hypothetical protein